MENAEEISAFWVLVERAMRRKGWTQSRLSKEADISQTSLQMYRSGGHSPRMDTVDTIAAALGAHPKEFTYAPSSRVERESGQLVRRLLWETGLRRMASISKAMGVDRERLEDCALGTASLTAGEMRRLMEIIHTRNSIAPQTAEDVSPGGVTVRRKDVDRLLDGAEASRVMDENDRVALAVLLRKRDVAQLMSDLRAIDSAPAKPSKATKKAGKR